MKEKTRYTEEQRERALATEDLLVESLDQLKAKYLDDRTKTERQLEHVQEELDKNKSMAAEQKRQNSMLQLEISSLRTQVQNAKEAMDHLREDHAAKNSNIKNHVEQLEMDKSNTLSRLSSVQIEMQEQTNTLKSTVAQQGTSDQRCNLLERTVIELEENTVFLRRQLLEKEQHFASRIEELTGMLQAAEHTSSFNLQELDKVKTNLSNLKESSSRQNSDLRSTRSELTRKASQLVSTEECFNRMLTLQKTLEIRSEKSEHKMEALHQRLLEETARSSSLENQLESERNVAREWANSRLDLLNSFVDEASRF